MVDVFRLTQDFAQGQGAALPQRLRCCHGLAVLCAPDLRDSVLLAVLDLVYVRCEDMSSSCSCVLQLLHAALVRSVESSLLSAQSSAEEPLCSASTVICDGEEMLSDFSKVRSVSVHIVFLHSALTAQRAWRSETEVAPVRCARAACRSIFHYRIMYGTTTSSDYKDHPQVIDRGYT